MRKLERDSKLKEGHLTNHELKANFRARMVDWMCEVMNIAFKNTCTDQTYFLAVNLLDRYIQSFEARSEVFKA